MSGGREAVRDAVVRALADGALRAGAPVPELTDDSDILGSGLVDSLGFVDLLMAVEADLGTPVALERLDFEAIDSLGSLVDQLQALREPLGDQDAA